MVTTAVQQSAGLSIKEAADHLGISQTTVRRRVKEGTLLARQQPTSQGFEWRIVLDKGSVVSEQVPATMQTPLITAREEFLTIGDQVPITVDQVVATLHARPDDARHDSLVAFLNGKTEPASKNRGGACTDDQTITTVLGIPWTGDISGDVPADTRKDAPAAPVTPAPVPGAGEEETSPGGPTSGEVQRLAELVDVLRSELAHRNTELEARAREVSELHVLLQQAQRALPHAGGQTGSADMQQAPAPPRQHQRLRWAFWRRS